MPSRSNPNTPSSAKRKTASVLKAKRRNTQRLASQKVTKPTPRTSQAIRRAAPHSRKKTRKIEKKIGFARKRKLEEMGEVEMRDVEKEGRNMREKMDDGDGKGAHESTKMDVDDGA